MARICIAFTASTHERKLGAQFRHALHHYGIESYEKHNYRDIEVLVSSIDDGKVAAINPHGEKLEPAIKEALAE